MSSMFMKVGNFISKFGIQIILIFFVLVGVMGIFYNFGMAESVGDESVLTTTTLKMIASKSLTPADPFNYHMPLAPYVYLPFFVVALGYLRLSGLFPDTESIIALGTVDWAVFLPLARLISVLFGALSVYLIYLATKKLFESKNMGLLSAFLLAFSMMLVKISHFGKVWTLQIATILAAFYAIVVLYKAENSKLRQYILSAVGIALAFMSHFIGVLIGGTLLIVHFLKRDRSTSLFKVFIERKFVVAALIVLLSLPVAYALNPYGVSNYFSRAQVTISGEVAADVVEKNVLIDSIISEKIFFYLKIFFEYEPLLFLLGLIGFGLLFRDNRRIFLVIASFPALYYLFIGLILGGNGLRFEPRFALPLIPFFAIAGAYTLNRLLNWEKLAKAVRFLGVAVLLLVSGFGSLLWMMGFLHPNTAELAEDWILKNIPANSRIAHYDRGTPIPLPENEETLIDIQTHNPAFFTTAHQYLLNAGPNNYYTKPTYYVLLAPHYDKIGVPNEIVEKGFDYAILNWWTEDDRERALNGLEFLEIEKQTTIKRFPEKGFEKGNINVAGKLRRPYKELPGLEYTGPVIEIVKISKE